MKRKTDEQWAQFLNDAFSDLCAKCELFLQEKMRECAREKINAEQELDPELAGRFEQVSDDEISDAIARHEHEVNGDDIYPHIDRVAGCNENLYRIIVRALSEEYEL